MSERPWRPTAARRALARQSVTLGAGQAQELGWDFQVPLAASSLSWQLDANAFDPVGVAVSDKMTVSQKVATATPVRTIQATLLQLDQPQTMKVQAPCGDAAGARRHSGALQCAPGRRPAGRARVHVALPLHLLRTEHLARGRPARPENVEGAHGAHRPVHGR
ncbi:hypothetical protein LP419_06675 [Massilia sp. H-1]|nr:hypothetical protein LP419_06675 [Massilia sp. H-1]